MYLVTIVVRSDDVNDEIGFRTIETKGIQILLNGELVFLKGICLYNENPLCKDRANSIDDAWTKKENKEGKYQFIVGNQLFKKIKEQRDL